MQRPAAAVAAGIRQRDFRQRSVPHRPAGVGRAAAASLKTNTRPSSKSEWATSKKETTCNSCQSARPLQLKMQKRLTMHDEQRNIFTLHVKRFVKTQSTSLVP